MKLCLVQDFAESLQRTTTLTSKYGSCFNLP